MRIKTPKYNWQNYKFGTISLCMIMKNEEKLLPRCLKSVIGLVDEIIIVDTGSVDNSVKIAEAYGARVFHDPWQDDFARPRNIGIENARGQWIFIMDPDEVIDRKHHKDILWLTRAKNVQAFWLTTRNYGGYIREPDYIYLEGGRDPQGIYPGFTPSTKTRFFKNGLGIRFEGCYHELVDYYLIRNKLKIGKVDIPIHHWAHEINQKTFQEKKDFYLRLGEKKVRAWPGHNQARWELAVTEMIYGCRGRAARSIAKAMQLGMVGHKQYFALARCLNFLKQTNRAHFAFEKGVCGLYPNLTHIDPGKRPLEALTKGLQ